MRVLIIIIFIISPIMANAKEPIYNYVDLFVESKRVVSSMNDYDNLTLEEKGWLFLKFHLYQRSEYIFRELAEKGDNKKLYFFGLAYSLLGQKRFEDAKAFFRKAFPELENLSDKEVIPEINRRERKKNLIKIKMIEENKSDKSYNFNDYVELMELSSYVGDYRSSILYSKKALEIKNDYLVNLKLIEFFLKTEKYESAEKKLLYLYENFNQDGYLLTLLSVVYIKLNDYKKASYYYTRAKEYADTNDVEEVFKSYIVQNITELSDKFNSKNYKLNFNINQYSNSSDVTRESYGEDIEWLYRLYRFKLSHRKDFFYKNNLDSFSRDSLSFSMEGSIDNEIYLSLGLDSKFYNNNKLILPFYLTLGKSIDRFFSSITYESIDISDIEKPFGNLLYNYASDFGGAKKIIRSENLSFYLQYENEKIISFIKYIYGDYSDGNEKKSIIFDGMIKDFYLKGLKLGYTYFYLDFKNPSPLYIGNNFVESSYYDPINFEVHSIYLISEFISSFLKMVLELRGSYMPKSNSFGRTLNLSFDKVFFKNHSFRIELRNYHHDRGVGRKSIEDRFWANQVLLKYIFSF